ncbi:MULTISPECIES: sigma-70 family RNA polymerase sigma factor [Microbulbifer]|uniref:sigma-70 family RNA polymerase sigma factor n=1 Tax=Microbulbifer TaxID=48073 RepID=UPI001F0199DF|nr:sigma-70 family RNA polymerase sigma factor [Microbulbifer zhoushanensis]
METADVASSGLRHSLSRYLRRRLPDHAPVEDLLQDLLVKALAADRDGREINNLVGWLYAAARSAVADYYRSRGENMQELKEGYPDLEQEDISLHAELSECMMSFVAQLPPLYRETILASDIEGETMPAIAARMQVSVSAIKSRASRARGMLKRRLSACCHIETTGGLVSDYHAKSESCCGSEKPVSRINPGMATLRNPHQPTKNTG